VSPAPAARAGGAGTWEGFLAELAKGRAALATLLGRQGPSSLVVGADGRARLALIGLTPDEERLMADKRNQSACEQAHAKVFGRPLVIELAHASSPRPAPERAIASKDPLTERMVQDFEGTVEELS
jgi:hypothetical protein